MPDLSLNPVYLSARAAIVAPERAIPTSIYSVQKWLPRLGPERWCLIMLLRALCIDAPRRTNGTKHIICSLQELAEALDLNKRTLLRWFEHEPIPNDDPWRRIVPDDEKTKYLALFIPRLRYAYETHRGTAKRVGLVLEILMEDPVVPEDEVKLKRQVEMLQLQQGEIPLNGFGTSDHVTADSASYPPILLNSTSAELDDVKWQNVTLANHVNGQNVTLEDGVNGQNVTLGDSVKRQNVLSANSLKRQNVVLDESVKRQNVTLSETLKGQNVALPESVKGQNVTLGESLKRQNVVSDQNEGQNVTSPESVKGQNVTLEESLKRQNVTLRESLKGQNVALPESVKGQNVTSESLKGQNVTSLESVKGQNVTSLESLKGQNVTSSESVKGQNVTLEESLKRQNVTSPESLKGQNVALDEAVKGQFVTSQGDLAEVNGQNVTLQGGMKGQFVTSQSDFSDSVNVNMLYLLFKRLEEVNVNVADPKIFEPIVTLSEKLLDDHHSTAMLYKVLYALYPHHWEVYVKAVHAALEASANESRVNKGAVFVRTLRDLAEVGEIDLGLRSSPDRERRPSPPPMREQPQLTFNLPLEREVISADKAFWRDTQALLRQQMTQATYSSIIHGTSFVERHGDIFVIGVANKMSLDWLQHRLLATIERALTSVVGQPVSIEFRLLEKG